MIRNKAMSIITDELFKLNPWWEGAHNFDLIDRPSYINQFEKNFENRDILIITGLRRIGKTSILKLLIRKLLDMVNPKNILYASLDSIRLEQYSLTDIIDEYRKIHKLSRAIKIYLFLDEIGYRENAHIELKNFYDNENVKIFASSSSSAILRDKKSLLTGRTRTFEILPLSFKEFLSFKKLKIKKSETYLLHSYFEDYMRDGGVPEYILTDDISYLDNLINSIIYKDIVGYYKVRDVRLIKDYFRLLAERAGKQISLNKVANILGISPDTSRRFFNYFTDTFLIYAMERCGKLNEKLRAPKKVYFSDVGIKNLLTGFRDKGAVFENLVFLKLKNHNLCYYYQSGVELDFSWGDTILEVKYMNEMNKNQARLFDKINKKHKIIINSIEDYLSL